MLTVIGAVMIAGMLLVTPWQVTPLAVLRYAWPFMLAALVLIGTGAYFLIRKQPGKNVPH